MEPVFDEARRRELLNSLPGQLAASVGAIGQRHPPFDCLCQFLGMAN
jgi:hypothetical protein